MNSYHEYLWILRVRKKKAIVVKFTVLSCKYIFFSLQTMMTMPKSLVNTAESRHFNFLNPKIIPDIAIVVICTGKSPILT